jgi:hypothetical protein
MFIELLITSSLLRIWGKWHKIFCATLRAILNFTPRGEICPLGAKFTPGVNILCCLEECRGKHRISPPGDNFTPRVKFAPGGQLRPLGSKFSPMGEVKKGSSGTKHGRVLLWNRRREQERRIDYCDQGPKNLAKNYRFLTQNKAKLCKILIITLVCEKNANLFAENCWKSQKIVIITSAPGWPNDSAHR